MIVPDDLTLEEMIGALKVRLQEAKGDDDNNLLLAGNLTMLEIIKRELDKKEDKQ